MSDTKKTIFTYISNEIKPLVKATPNTIFIKVRIYVEGKLDIDTLVGFEDNKNLATYLAAEVWLKTIAVTGRNLNNKIHKNPEVERFKDKHKAVAEILTWLRNNSYPQIYARKIIEYQALMFNNLNKEKSSKKFDMTVYFGTEDLFGLMIKGNILSDKNRTNLFEALQTENFNNNRFIEAINQYTGYSIDTTDK